MKEQTIAKAYAKSIYQLGADSKIDIASELTKLTEVINQSNQLETVLFLDVFTQEEKASVAQEIMKKLNLSALATHFVRYLIDEKRLNLLPLVFKEVIVLDDHSRGFLRGVVEGASEKADEQAVAKIKEYLESKIGKKIELNYSQSSQVTAGYRVTVDDLQLDASLDNQLNKLREQILNA
jgi:F-type H+-transporting ATPase subunit delta